MLYALLKLGHILGVMLIGAGLIGVWMADLRARQLNELHTFSEAVRNIAVFYDGLVLPGAILLMLSGGWMIAAFYGGPAILDQPWLLGMIVLFLFEFVEGNTVTRLYFMRLRRLTRAALVQGQFTPELLNERHRAVPTFTHFLDLPILFLIVTLGTTRPDDWTLFALGSLFAITIAILLTLWLPRLYPSKARTPAGEFAS